MTQKTKAFTPLEICNSPNNNLRKRQRRFLSLTGFTLVELLIASSIFIVVMLTIYSAFHTGIFGYRNIEEAIDTYQAAGQILGRMNLDLRNSFVYSANETKFAGENKQISFLALVDSYQEDKTAQDYALVSYALEGNKLMRLCRINQDALNNESETTPEEMASNIEITFTYFYLDPADNSLKDTGAWNDKVKLPAAVKMNLTVKGKTETNFQRTVYLPLAR